GLFRSARSEHLLLVRIGNHPDHLLQLRRSLGDLARGKISICLVVSSGDQRALTLFLQAGVLSESVGPKRDQSKGERSKNRRNNGNARWSRHQFRGGRMGVACRNRALLCKRFSQLTRESFAAAATGKLRLRSRMRFLRNMLPIRMASRRNDARGARRKTR